MKYYDGQKVLLGDRVRLGQDIGGIVVCLIDAGEYSVGFSEEQWAYLKKGVMINYPLFGLIHYEQPEEDIELLGRA